MELVKLYLNVFSNMVLFVYSLMFYIYAFGDEQKAIAKWKIKKVLLLKIGVISIILGSLYSAVTLSDPSMGEVVLNIGLALLFAWVYDFHRRLFAEK